MAKKETAQFFNARTGLWAKVVDGLIVSNKKDGKAYKDVKKLNKSR